MIAVAGLWLKAVSPASALAIYQYTGAPYTAAFGPYQTTMRIEGRVVLESPIPADTPLHDVSDMVVRFVFTDGLNTYLPRDWPLGFSAATDADGAIVSWGLSFTDTFGPRVDLYYVTSFNPTGGTIFDLIRVENQDGTDFPAWSTAPGSWALVPEPSVATLCGLGLGTLAVMTRRRRLRARVR
jgi:hypothetical protein